MRIIRTIPELHAARAEARAAGATRVGFVPTMGALHEGHLSLLRAARAENDVVVLSIFVNPTQFTDSSDLDAYPRTEEADAELAAAAGVDLLFAPDAAELYPAGYATTVRVAGPLTETLEGAGRGQGHFDGMATIVTKLLLAVLPGTAYLGQKDAQQLLVVRRMVADLGIPTRIAACPTARDQDGLALSSRNVRLSTAERSRALAIPRALEAAAALVAEGVHEVAPLREAASEILAAADVAPEYLAFVVPESLAPVESVTGPVLCAIAARVGEVRLIDNVVLTPTPVPTKE